MDLSVQNALLGVCYYLDQNGYTSIPRERVDDFLSLLVKKMRFVDINSSPKELEYLLNNTAGIAGQENEVIFQLEDWWYTNRYTFNQKTLEFFNSTAEAYIVDFG